MRMGREIWSRGYKNFHAELNYEILNAHKYKNIKKNQLSHKPRMLFFLLISVKTPTNVGILTNFEQERKVHGQLSCA